jgi:hypothetical protein
MFRTITLSFKMVKTDTLTGPESNLEKRLDNRWCRMTGPVTVITGLERLGRTVTEPYRQGRGYLNASSSPSHHLRKRHC